MKKYRAILFEILKVMFLTGCVIFASCGKSHQPLVSSEENPRQRISINKNWRFYKYDTLRNADSLIYDVRPEITDKKDNKVADSKPTVAIELKAKQKTLKAWILPTGNPFIKDTSKHYTRPIGNPGSDFPFVQSDYDDSSWREVDLPHDWGIEGPFLEGWDAEVGGGMGRLASHGIAWYRKKLEVSMDDAEKSFFLDVEGAMSYAMVWINGKLAGGWPYGYNSWRVDLTPYIVPGEVNQLAIRIDNPPHSARWYPGGGLYRNIWLTKTNTVHVSHWGTYITTTNVTEQKADVNLEISIDNDSKENQNIEIHTSIFRLDKNNHLSDKEITIFSSQKAMIPANTTTKIKCAATINQPALWGPYPTQAPNLYMAVTNLIKDGKPVDRYETRFGVRTINYDPENGVMVNGKPLKFKGVNQHHDLGALGAAFNKRAAERQLEILQELGCNAIRMAHNPPAPELLELTDRMGFLVINEIFDVWEMRKTPLDFHLIFPDWYEQDTRAFIRRDRNCPSVIIWSFGNEVGEQYTDSAGADLAQRLINIIKEEDITRPTTVSMNYAKPGMPFADVAEVISLNYQGEGIRDAPAYSHLKGIRTSPLYPDFHTKYPDKIIVSSETASALSTRGTYLFPVFEGKSAPAEDGLGGDPETQYVSSYELYTAPFGSSADKVFASQDKHPYVAGEFVWTGWDYLGEPTPYYLSRSSYSGIIDLAGFKKDRFYLYQARWRPELRMVHILPHWNWPERIGKITPVHVITSGDEAELFLNDQSLGKKKKEKYEYRLRWDNIKYTPGELKVVAYKNGEKWAEEIVKTSGEPAKIIATSDRDSLKADGKDLAFITVKINDIDDVFVANSNNLIEFSIDGPGEIIATDNGDPSDMEIFSMHKRKAFNGMALVIVKASEGKSGNITLKARGKGLDDFEISITAIK